MGAYGRVEGVSLEICMGIVVHQKSGIVGRESGGVNGGGAPRKYVGKERGELGN